MPDLADREHEDIEDCWCTPVIEKLDHNEYLVIHKSDSELAEERDKLHRFIIYIARLVYGRGDRNNKLQSIRKVLADEGLGWLAGKRYDPDCFKEFPITFVNER